MQFEVMELFCGRIHIQNQERWCQKQKRTEILITLTHSPETVEFQLLKPRSLALAPVHIIQMVTTINHIRPKVVENTGSRPLSHSQATNRRISSWVGDDQRIPAVVCFFMCKFLI
ncbi:hypothetical protein DER44DRAFT_147007 [Fusarium oxysporum]|nr:hypothetical protein DER44DRAFT_147007 [Fusarium oxysporum]